MKLSVTKDVLTKSNAAFQIIAQNPQYSILAAVIFATACLLSFANYFSSFYLLDEQQQNGYIIAYHITSFVGITLKNFLVIVFTFYIGKRYSGNTNFRQVFSVLSFCLIPTVIGAVLFLLGNNIASFFLVSEDIESQLHTSHAFAFAFSNTLNSIFTIPFFIWFCILFVKAVKVLDDFATLQAIIVLIVVLVLVYYGLFFLYSLGTSIMLQAFFSETIFEY